MTAHLGKLEKVELRHAWMTEAGDFTPWLSNPENLAQLADAIGISLEFEAAEKDVGPFRADILCKDVGTDHWVLIENQLERTDHTHLGQLLTYAAGLKVVTIVWVAARFTEEHRAALDWLNEITDDRFNFFGLEVELWRIGDSPIAPKFNVVCKPNDWSRTVTQEASRLDADNLSEASKLQLEFWIAFREYALEHATRIRPTKPFPLHWMHLALGRTGARLAAIASLYDSEKQSYDGHVLRAEVVLTGPDSKLVFQVLHSMREEIESEIGEPLIWYNPPDKNMCRIYLRRAVDLMDREKWDDYHGWLVEKLDALHRVFFARVRNLNTASGDEQAGTNLSVHPTPESR